jgi:hypothetical protein
VPSESQASAGHSDLAPSGQLAIASSQMYAETANNKIEYIFVFIVYTSV